MAERASRDREGSTTTTTRRQSFRRSLADAELPDDDLERLEAKRKQLDDSIHKYIAAKEREYKSYERELIQKHKLGIASEAQRARRTSSESTHSQDLVDSPRLLGQSSSAVNALLSAGIRREQIGSPLAVTAVADDDGPGTTLEARQSVAGLTDRRASTDRDKEFIGVFTPAFLPALDVKGSALADPQKAERERHRAESAPPLSSSHSQQITETEGPLRADSDTSVLQARQQGPIQLQLSGRTSSSGSSADGKLPSALKSPTNRPHKKRVSLAVGDSIVAPSDNVPLTFNSQNNTPSHSRTRSPASPDRANGKAAVTSDHTNGVTQAESSTAPFSPLARATMTSQSKKVEQTVQDVPEEAVASSSSAPIVPGPSTSSPKMDVDGDLQFGLGGDEALSDHALEESPLDSEDEVTGRVAPHGTSPSSGEVIYDSSEDMIPAGAEESDDHAEHIEFRPSSIQHASTPGFRRPSATMDPVYTGPNYARAEHSAVTNEVYGSSFIRPSSKGSFTAGSLGESFMAQNAERLMRNRAASGETQVRS